MMRDWCITGTIVLQGTDGTALSQGSAGMRTKGARIHFDKVPAPLYIKPAMALSLISGRFIKTRLNRLGRCRTN
jgi:hypothetical protein